MANSFTRRRFVGAGLGFLAAGASASILSGCNEKKPEKSFKGRPLSLQSPWVNDAEFIGYFVAMANGYYEEEGISFEYKPGGPDKLAVERLAARAADIALTNIDGTVAAITEQGAPFTIIGAQYQKSPLGIVSLAENGIRKPSDLVGRRLAAPKANVPTIEAFLRLNKVDPADVRIVDYQYDPTILVDGIVDATVDFVTNVPYTVRLRNKIPSSFLLYDFGFKQFMDTVVVRTETLATKRKDLVGFLKASRRGWVENFKDVNLYPPKFSQSFFKDTGRTIDNEKFFNSEQKPLMESPNGIFSMSDEDIEKNIDSLRDVGLKAKRNMFETDILSEIQ